jgi:quinohemoprotein ethanol dehydrogenase
MAPPITYALDGRQYVAVLAGWGGASALFGASFTGEYKPEGRLWTFALGGDTNIVPVSGQPLPALTAIPFDASEAVQTLGADLYGQRCAMCHGRNAAGGGALADLRYAAPTTYAIFHDIVREGAYGALGMPNLGAFLDEAEAEAIKQYILGRRAALLE